MYGFLYSFVASKQASGFQMAYVTTQCTDSSSNHILCYEWHTLHLNSILNAYHILNTLNAKCTNKYNILLSLAQHKQAAIQQRKYSYCLLIYLYFDAQQNSCSRNAKKVVKCLLCYTTKSNLAKWSYTFHFFRFFSLTRILVWPTFFFLYTIHI